MKKLLLTAAISFGLGFTALRAGTPVAPQVYLLTNNTFSIANGATNLANGTDILNSTPFPIWRGRGFMFHSCFWGTNAGTDNLTFTFQTATPVYSAGAWHTNWNTSGTFTAAVAQNGSTVVYGASLIPATTTDNEELCRISTVANAHASTIFLDPTNTFISVIP